MDNSNEHKYKKDIKDFKKNNKKQYAIQEILSFKIIEPIVKTNKVNVPHRKKVAEIEYFEFLEVNREYIEESYGVYLEHSINKDYYGNVVASMSINPDGNTYYINPKLLKLGLKEKKKIEDDVDIVGERVVAVIENLKSTEFNTK